MKITHFLAGLGAGKASAAAAGVELNIAYGDEPPADTSKLWVKTTEPKKVVVSALPCQDSTENDYGESNYGSVSDTAGKVCKTCCARVGDYVYTFGGRYSLYSNSAYSSDYIVKFKKSSVTKLSTRTASYSHMCCAAVGEKIYIFQCNNTTTAFCFDPTTEKITTLGSVLPVADKLMTCAAVGTKVYIFGGYSNPTAIYCFDTETNQAEALTATLKKATHTAGCAAVGTKVYIVGGLNTTDGALDTIQCFDTETGETSILSARLPSGKYGMGVAALGDKIVVYGGISGIDGTSYVPNATIQVIDTATNTVRQARKSADSPMWASCAPAPDNDRQIIVVGGCKTANTGTNNYQAGGLNDLLWTYRVPLDIDLDEGTMYFRIASNTAYADEFALIGNAGLDVKVIPDYIFKGFAGGVGRQVEGVRYKDGAWATV
jgi:hypothetical protein